MKKISYIVLLSLILAACRQNIVPKPKNFINKEQMESLLYDLALLETMENSQTSLLDSLQFKPKEFIYQKYHIDSISLSENMVYYASFPKEYDTIVHRVEKRLKAQRDSVSKALSMPPKSLEEPLEQPLEEVPLEEQQ